MATLFRRHVRDTLIFINVPGLFRMVQLNLVIPICVTNTNDNRKVIKLSQVRMMHLSSKIKNRS
jgi:hypothetical protein